MNLHYGNNSFEMSIFKHSIVTVYKHFLFKFNWKVWFLACLKCPAVSERTGFLCAFRLASQFWLNRLHFNDQLSASCVRNMLPHEVSAGAIVGVLRMVRTCTYMYSYCSNWPWTMSYFREWNVSLIFVAVVSYSMSLLVFHSNYALICMGFFICCYFSLTILDILCLIASKYCNFVATSIKNRHVCIWISTFSVCYVLVPLTCLILICYTVNYITIITP